MTRAQKIIYGLFSLKIQIPPYSSFFEDLTAVLTWSLPWQGVPLLILNQKTRDFNAFFVFANVIPPEPPRRHPFQWTFVPFRRSPFAETALTSGVEIRLSRRPSHTFCFSVAGMDIRVQKPRQRVDRVLTELQPRPSDNDFFWTQGPGLGSPRNACACSLARNQLLPERFSCQGTPGPESPSLPESL